jgi:hypothetical protein
MINASGWGLRISLGVNVYRYILWLWFKLWINNKIHGINSMLNYKIKF